MPSDRHEPASQGVAKAMARSDPTPGRGVGRFLDALAYSSVLAAAVAGTLAAAASLAFELPLSPFVIALVTSGTLVVYNIDRLRDLEQDRPRAPLRSAFVERHQRRLGLLTLVAALVSGISALGIPRAAVGVCAGVLVLGLLHRRLKLIRGIKTLYLTVAWLAVVLGLPLLATRLPPATASVSWTFAIIGCAILANLLASNLDRQKGDERPRHVADRSRLGSAIVVAGLGVGSALVAPEALRSLVLIPMAELLVLCRFREGEHYGLVVVDGALLAGACGSIALLMFSRAAA